MHVECVTDLPNISVFAINDEILRISGGSEAYVVV